MSDSIKSYNQIAGRNVKRLEAIGDGVFAIALTLLVLDLRVPINEGIKTENDLFRALIDLTPKFLSYFLSFMTLGIFWTGHAAQFSYIEKSDRHLNWLNLFFLLFVSILPFTTAFLSEYIEFKLAIGLYWLNIFALGIIILVHWNYADRQNFLTISGEERETVGFAIRRRVIVAQSLYAFGALLCFVNTYVSIIFIVVVQLNYAMAVYSGKKKIEKM